MISDPEVNHSDLLESNWLQKGIQSAFWLVWAVPHHAGKRKVQSWASLVLQGLYVCLYTVKWTFKIAKLKK